MHISFLKKKNVEWNYDNGITEIGGKKNCPNWFMAMSLPKLRGGGEMWQWICGNGIAEIEERYKKKYAYSYSFGIFFLPKQFGLSCSFMVKVPYETDKDRFKYNDSYSKVHAVKKKYIYIYRFL